MYIEKNFSVASPFQSWSQAVVCVSMPRIYCALVVRLYRTGNFLQNILGCYSGTTKDSETNDISFESPIIEPLELLMKEGVAVL